MSRISTLSHRAWTDPADPEIARVAVTELEAGAVLFFHDLEFRVDTSEGTVFSTQMSGGSKNVSFDPATGRISGTAVAVTPGLVLRALLTRFSDAAAAFLSALLTDYRGRLIRARASFRPAEIEGRPSSWRKDDTKLHVDSFPASPVRDHRILRLFSNVNPHGRVRSWRVGDEFETVARRFAGSLRMPLPGRARLLQLLHVTKSTRSPYDALMLQLHDLMKADPEFQATTPQQRIDFPAGSTWLAFTDEVSHAAMAGQHQLEQTFLLPVDAMQHPERSPLRILERLKGRHLV